MRLREKAIKKDDSVSLGSLKGGDVFRFSHISFSQALVENAFYLVITSPDKKSVLIANLFDGQCLLRDKEHQVTIHKTVVDIEV